MSRERRLHALVHPPPFYALVIAAGTLALGVSFYDLARQPVGSAWLILLGLTAITGWSTLTDARRAGELFVSDTFTIAAALLFGPAVGTVTVVVDALIMSLRVASAIRRFVWPHVLFSVTAAPLAMFVERGCSSISRKPDHWRPIPAAFATSSCRWRFSRQFTFC